MKALGKAAPQNATQLFRTGDADPITSNRMNRRKADFKFAYKFLEDDL